MKLTVAEAMRLAEQAMAAVGHDRAECAIIAHHLVDAELRGLSYGGLPRALSMVERMSLPTYRRVPLAVVHETPVSALVAGGNNTGYLAGRRAAEIAIEKAVTTGVGVVGVNDTWHTGMLSYYAEMAAKRDMVSMIASNASPWVAPHGGTEGRFGTNPICFGFPSADEPIIWDIGTSSMMHGELVLARRLGKSLPEGVGFDKDGNPTVDPAAALGGAITVWGGHRGSGLAIAVQLLGAMAAAPVMPKGMVGYGCLFVVMRPDLLMPAAEYKAKVSEYAEAVRSTRPVAGGARVRMPFDRSVTERNRRLAEDAIEVPDAIHAQLATIAASNKLAG
jgi:LDH2 family malate/lactate/ureidoglycolate dehydrogenase